MKYLILFFVAVLLSISLFSQNNLLLSYKSYFDNDLKSWTHSFKNFDLTKFKLDETRKFENVLYGDTKNLKEFYEIYKPALSFSFDSSEFIDIYSYWLGLEKNGNKIFSNAEVDQAVSLCDIKNNKWKRIIFCGLSTRVEEVLWINNRNFILTGGLLDDTNTKNVFHPKILIGDITKKVFFIYTDSSSISNTTGYISPKIKKLNIVQ